MAGEIRGRVVDFETGIPLSGVAIVAIWELQGVEGRHVRNLAVQETISDDAGGFRIPGWGPRINGRFLYASLPDNAPRLILFRRDHEPLVFNNNSAATSFGFLVQAGELQDADHRLRRWSTDDPGRVRLGQQVDAEIRNILTAPDCEWRHVRGLLIELHNLGLATSESGGRSLMLDRIPDRDCGDAETISRERLQ